RRLGADVAAARRRAVRRGQRRLPDRRGGAAPAAPAVPPLPLRPGPAGAGEPGRGRAVSGRGLLRGLGLRRRLVRRRPGGSAGAAGFGGPASPAGVSGVSWLGGDAVRGAGPGMTVRKAAWAVGLCLAAAVGLPVAAHWLRGPPPPGCALDGAPINPAYRV